MALHFSEATMNTGMLLIILPTNTRFSPGRIVMTHGVDALVREGRFHPNTYLDRHLAGDWGDLSDADRQHNDRALQSRDDRMFSSYQVAPDLTLWIITEWDRSVTTLLLPKEY
jgi:hypothetical protein